MPNIINGTKLKVGQRAVVVSNEMEKDDNGSLLGLKGELTHPFASGCTDKGWVGFRSDTYTPWGYHINFHESEIKIIE